MRPNDTTPRPSLDQAVGAGHRPEDRRAVAREWDQRARAADTAYEAHMAAFRADARGVHLVGVSLTFDDVFRIVLAVLAAQLLLLGIVGAFAGLIWLAVR